MQYPPRIAPNFSPSRHNLRSIILAGAAICALALPNAALAAEDDDEPQIVVSATLAQSTADDLGVSIDVIDREEIDASPASTVDELLRDIPGVQLPLSNQNYNFPANPSVAIRGLGLGDNGTRTLVLIDGTPANGGFFGNVFWNRIPIEALESVEVIRGGGSGVHGAFAQGGTINLVTSGVDAGDRAEAELSYGSFDTINASLSTNTQLTENLNLGLFSGYVESDGFFEVIRDQRDVLDQRTSYENETFRASLDYRAADNLDLFIRGGYYEQSQDGTTPISQSNTEVFDIVTGGDLDLGHSSVKWRAFYQNEEFQTFNPANFVRFDRSSEFLGFTSLSESDDYGASLAWTFELGGILRSASIGIDGRIIEGDNDAQTFRPDGSLFLDEVTVGKQESLGIYGELILDPTPNTDIVLNVRGDFFRNGDASRVANGVEEDLPTNKFEEISFRAAVNHHITDDLRVRGALYRSFRAPTLAELYRSFGTSTFQGRANELLDPETLFGGELGLTYLDSAGRRLEVTVFRNTVDDFVGSVPISFFPVFTLQNTNLGETRSQGVEVIGELPIGQHLSLRAGYVYLDTEIRENPLDEDLIGNRIEGAPENTVHWGIRVNDFHGFNADFRGRYLSSQFQDAGNETRLGSHTVFDIRVGYEVNDNIELFVAGENIFDEDYAASAFSNLIQRGTPASVRGGVRLSL